MLPLVVNVPGPPVMLPPLQLSALVMMPSLPVNVAPAMVSGLAKLTVGPVVSKLTVPLFRLVVPVAAML